MRVYMIVVTWAHVVCLICTLSAHGIEVLRLLAYILGRPLISMLTLLHVISISENFTFTSVVIVILFGYRYPTKIFSTV